MKKYDIGTISIDWGVKMNRNLFNLIVVLTTK